MKDRYQSPVIIIESFTIGDIVALSVVDEGPGLEGDE